MELFIICVVLLAFGFLIGAFCMWVSMRREVAAAKFLNDRMAKKINGLERCIKAQPNAFSQNHV